MRQVIKDFFQRFSEIFTGLWCGSCSWGRAERVFSSSIQPFTGRRAAFCRASCSSISLSAFRVAW